METAFDEAPGDARALVEAIGGFLAHGLPDFAMNPPTEAP
jgi:hypothetical protein